METINEKFIILSNGFDETIDITQKIRTVVSNCKAKTGLVTITSPNPTVSFLKIDTSKGLTTDIKNILSSIIPVHKIYEYDNNSLEGNAFSHLKALIMGNSLTICINEGFLELAQECAVALIDFNNKSSQTAINITVVFEKEK